MLVMTRWLQETLAVSMPLELASRIRTDSQATSGTNSIALFKNLAVTK
jgi:hypothetical protein